MLTRVSMTAACVLALFTARPAAAMLTAEWNFTVDETANYVNGPSSAATLNGSAAVTTGPNGATGFFIPTAKNGRLTIPDSSGNNLQTTSTFSAFFSNVSAGVGGFNPGVGTAVILWRPLNATSSPREYLLNHANDTNRQAVSISRLSDSTMTIHIGRNTENSLVAATSAITWDPSSYYLVAGSWDSNATGFTTDSGGQVAIYVRKLEEASALLSGLNTGNIVGTSSGGTDVSLLVGMRTDASGEYAEGDYGLVRFYDEFFTADRFNSEFNSLVPAPEPGTLLLVMAGALALPRLRRRRS